mmetsp:Transcript_10308/g.26851  ORF Transcript_10308/g.26851 Transcript_10308/m.26851 type:complete len:739 (-) Transcript_10308:850-3066(-)
MSIQPAPGEKGVYYVSGGASKTVQTWTTGERYVLTEFLGEGSFSCVCLAIDTRTQEKVAVKRLGNVLGDLEGAKCVLREVCILRRLYHPNICALKDAFLRPSSTGGFVLRDGNFVAKSVDLYCVLEYCDHGDLFHLRGQLLADQVKSIMWQLLGVLRFLHSNNVWHRDIKSANVLVQMREGKRVVKLCDFGSARSGYSWHGPGTEPTKNHASLDLEMTDMGGACKGMKCVRAPQKRSGFETPLTRVVCTPCYRAPEVVMSHGNYSSALDMWSLGCILGELVQRIPYLGKSSTPHLQVAPVICISSLPNTPSSHDTYEGPGNPHTRKELDALFSVIGTPPWSTIDAAVRLPNWHHYLRHATPKAPQLYRRFGAAGEVTLDLLRRLLEFDPSRRASAEEAMHHEYFSGLEEEVEEDEGEVVREASVDQMAVDKTDGGEVGATIQMLAQVPSSWGSACTDASSLINLPLHKRRANSGAASASAVAHAATHSAGGEDASMQDAQELPQATQQAPGDVEMQGFSTGPAPTPQDTKPGHPRKAVKRQRSFFDLKDPSEALAALELELVDITTADDHGADRMRDMLARECEELHIMQQQMEVAQRAAMEAAEKLGATVLAKRADSGPVELWLTHARDQSRGRHHSQLPRSEGLMPDSGHAEDPSAIGKQRLPHHADTELADRDAEKHLREGRHGEWAPTSLPESQVKSADCLKRASWGVTLCPPGVNEGEMTPGMEEAIRRQHAR